MPYLTLGHISISFAMYNILLQRKYITAKDKFFALAKSCNEEKKRRENEGKKEKNGTIVSFTIQKTSNRKILPQCFIILILKNNILESRKRGSHSNGSYYCPFRTKTQYGTGFGDIIFLLSSVHISTPPPWMKRIHVGEDLRVVL